MFSTFMVKMSNHNSNGSKDSTQGPTILIRMLALLVPIRLTQQYWLANTLRNVIHFHWLIMHSQCVHHVVTDSSSRLTNTVHPDRSRLNRTVVHQECIWGLLSKHGSRRRNLGNTTRPSTMCLPIDMASVMMCCFHHSRPVMFRFTSSLSLLVDRFGSHRVTNQGNIQSCNHTPAYTFTRPIAYSPRRRRATYSFGIRNTFDIMSK